MNIFSEKIIRIQLFKLDSEIKDIEAEIERFHFDPSSLLYYESPFFNFNSESKDEIKTIKEFLTHMNEDFLKMKDNFVRLKERYKYEIEKQKQIYLDYKEFLSITLVYTKNFTQFATNKKNNSKGGYFMDMKDMNLIKYDEIKKRFETMLTEWPSRG